MTVQIQLSGPVLVQIDPGDGLVTLGWCARPPTVSERPYYLPVHTDASGGLHGPPSEMQYLGKVTSVRLALSKYDAAVAAQLKPGMAPEGVTGGLALRSAVRVFLSGTSESHNFPRCLLSEPYEFNLGARHTVLLLEFQSFDET